MFSRSKADIATELINVGSGCLSPEEGSQHLMGIPAAFYIEEKLSQNNLPYNDAFGRRFIHYDGDKIRITNRWTIKELFQTDNDGVTPFDLTYSDFDLTLLAKKLIEDKTFEYLPSNVWRLFLATAEGKFSFAKPPKIEDPKYFMSLLDEEMTSITRELFLLYVCIAQPSLTKGKLDKAMVDELADRLRYYPKLWKRLNASNKGIFDGKKSKPFVWKREELFSLLFINEYGKANVLMNDLIEAFPEHSFLAKLPIRESYKSIFTQLIKHSAEKAISLFDDETLFAPFINRVDPFSNQSPLLQAIKAENRQVVGFFWNHSKVEVLKPNYDLHTPIAFLSSKKIFSDLFEKTINQFGLPLTMLTFLKLGKKISVSFELMLMAKKNNLKSKVLIDCMYGDCFRALARHNHHFGGTWRKTAIKLVEMRDAGFRLTELPNIIYYPFDMRPKAEELTKEISSFIISIISTPSLLFTVWRRFAIKAISIINDIEWDNEMLLRGLYEYYESHDDSSRSVLWLFLFLRKQKLTLSLPYPQALTSDLKFLQACDWIQPDVNGKTLVDEPARIVKTYDESSAVLVHLPSLLDRKKLPLYRNSAGLQLNSSLAKHVAWVYEHIYQFPYVDNFNMPRLHHGLQHAVRAAVYATSLINWGRLFAPQNSAILQLTPRDILFVQLALFFHDAAREDDGEDKWDLESASLYYFYLVDILKISPDEAKIYATALANKDSLLALFDEEMDKGFINLPGKDLDNKFDYSCWYLEVLPEKRLHWKKTSTLLSPKVLMLAACIHDGDCADILRVSLDFNMQYLQVYQKYAYDNDEAKLSLSRLILEMEKLIDYQGDGLNTFCVDKRNEYNRPGAFDRLVADLSSGHFPLLKIFYAEGKILSHQEIQEARRLLSQNRPNSLQQLAAKVLMESSNPQVPFFNGAIN